MALHTLLTASLTTSKSLAPATPLRSDLGEPLHWTKPAAIEAVPGRRPVRATGITGYLVVLATLLALPCGIVAFGALEDHLGGRATWQFHSWLLIFPLGAVGAILAARWIVRPLRDLTHATRLIAAGDTTTRALTHGPREIAALAAAVNTMADERAAANDRVASLSRRLLNAGENERRRIAHELHDEFAQSLAALHIHLKAMARSTQAPNASPSTECGTAGTDAALAIVTTLTAQVRERALNLRPPQLDLLGLVPAIEWFTANARKAYGDVIHLHVAGEVRRLGASLESVSYRIVQEALNNALRHANASRIDVAIAFGADRLSIEIRDDGDGFDTRTAEQNAVQGKSIGLATMRDRADLSNGTWRLRSAPGQGTLISCVWTLAKDASTQ